MKNLLRACALLGALAVGLGAFGAHGLKSLVGPDQLVTFNTGIRYHFYHALGIGMLAPLWHAPGINHVRLRQAGWCWGVGILLFSGSLYLLSLAEVMHVPTSVLGPVTPVGGLFFIAGWVLLLLAPADRMR